VILGPASEKRVRNGQVLSLAALARSTADPLTAPPVATTGQPHPGSGQPQGIAPTDAGDEGESGGTVRAYTADGRFLAILATQGPGRWQPEKVFDVTPVE